MNGGTLRRPVCLATPRSIPLPRPGHQTPPQSNRIIRRAFRSAPSCALCLVLLAHVGCSKVRLAANLWACYDEINPRIPCGARVLITDIAEIVALVRDILLLVLLAVALLIAVVVYSKVSTILNSVRRTIKETEAIIATVSEKVVGPAGGGSGIARAAGKTLSFLFGLSRRGRKERKNDGE